MASGKAAAENPPAKPKEFGLLPKIINGGLAGMIGMACVFPLDLAKTRLQNQQIGPDGQKQYTGIPDVFRKTIQREGIRGMYRGAAVVIALITPEKAIKLSANDYFRFHFRKADGTLSYSRQIAAGGLAGFCKVTVTTPMEYLKIQLQDAGRVKAKVVAEGAIQTKQSATRIAYDLLATKGVRALYTGYCSTLLRDVLFSSIYFPMFAFFNSFGYEKPPPGQPVVEQSPFWVNFMAGLFAGCIAGWSVTPCDVVKTRLQTVNKAPGEKYYTGIPNAFITIARDEGLLAFFKGGACRIMVIAPLFAIAQVVYFLGVGEYICGYGY